mgnify:CR=1 FL=1
MKYVIYIDVFFCVNLVMDFVIIKLASLYIKPQTTYLRCFLGALTGSVLTVLSIVIPFKSIVVHMLLSYVFIGLIMACVTYGIVKITYVIRNFLVIYVMTIFMGGLINYIYSYTQLGYAVHNVINGIFRGVNIVWLIGISAVSYIIIKGIINFILQVNIRNMKVIVRLTINGITKELYGLIDTGNSLYEPYTDKPVHIVCKHSISEIISDLDLYTCNIKFVPYRSIGKKNGLLKTIECDAMLVYSIDNAEGVANELIYEEHRAIIGLHEGVLSGKSEFEMILHRCINQEGGLI